MKKVTAAVLEKDGLLLIAQRKFSDSLGGKWEFPGGKVEAGETPEQCLRRELKEEFGIEAEVGAFLCPSRFEYRHIKVELLAYRCRHLAGEFRLNDHERIAWVRPADLRAYDFSPADLPVIEFLLKR